MPKLLLTKGIITADDAKRQRLCGKKDWVPLTIDNIPIVNADDAIKSRRIS